MANRKIILIADDKLYLSRGFSINLSDIFPSNIKFSRQELFWEVEGKYSDGKLLLRVVNYHPTDYSNFGRQELSKPIRGIIFEELNWNELQDFLLTKAQSEFDRLNTTNEVHQSECSIPDIIYMGKQAAQREYVREQFEVLYKDATIEDGKILFEKKLKWHQFPIQFQIKNSYLKKEFDSIKFYFGKVISKSKRFTVHALITLDNKWISEVYATSPEIEQINYEIVDVIKAKRIKDVINIQSKKDKSLVNADELFGALDGNEENLLNQSSEEIIREVITWNRIRNGKQLQYLSGLKQSQSDKILFSLKPHFGFMFTISVLNKKYYCWELLNSHATYIWIIDNDFHGNTIEAIISKIQIVGRNNYKQQYKAGLIDQDIKFEVLIHSSENVTDSFLHWKLQLEKVLK